MTPLEQATIYTRRAWCVIPIPHRSKNPGITRWQKLRLTEPELPAHFNGQPQNVGVHMGEPSGWVVDVDLDHARCLELADGVLPPTPSEFGRKSSPRSHRLYRVTGPVACRRLRSKSAGTLVELRSTGEQTVFPGSTHESGEPIEWSTPEAETAEPAVIDPDVLLAAVEKLGNTVKIELGEKAGVRPRKKKDKSASASPAPADAPTSSADGIEPEARVKLALAAMLRMGMTDHKDGSSRLFAAMCRAVEHDLIDELALRTFREYERQRPFPQAWNDQSVLIRLRDAENHCERGAALRASKDEDGCIRLGTRDPETGKLVLSPKRTLPTARAFVEEFYAHPAGRALHSYAGTILAWRDNRFAELEDETLRKDLQPWLHESLRYVFDKRSGALRLANFESNPATVEAALNSIRAHAHLPARITPPTWLVPDATLPDPLDLLPCLSGNLHVPSGTVLPPTPNLFNINALDFDYDPKALPPLLWLDFLAQLWEDDKESICLLQEWMGYCLVADTSQQKMLLMVGPKRSGKGTIGRVLTRLVGTRNVVGPTTSSLAGNFGLQPLIGKTLAIVSDARFSGESVGIVVERLLCISGEDTLTVDRKFLGAVTMKLLTRFMFLTNELPRMNDASGALAGRFVILRLTKSFYGQEDVMLTAKLMEELPGILLWAIEGLKRLRQRGHFVQPASVAEAVRELEDLASPVGAFVRDCCELGAGHRTWIDDMYSAWKRWCERDGRTMVTNRQTFGRDLSAAAPGVVCRRHSVQGRFYDGVALLLDGGVP